MTKKIVCLYREQHPQATWSEVAQILGSHHQFNPQLLEASLQGKSSNATFEPDMLHALNTIVEVFEMLNISYYIGGSLASAVYGMGQSAKDIDLVIELSPAHIPQFVALLSPHYYVDKKNVYTAVQENKKFTIMHLDTLLFIDIIIPHLSQFEMQIKNRVRWQILEEARYPLPLSSPEDIILIKLFLHKEDKNFPDALWNEILGVLKVQGAGLDFVYLEQWAQKLEIADLLRKGYVDAGLQEAKIEVGIS